MLLDIEAARVVAQAKLFERVVHDPGPWAIRIGDAIEWAVRARINTGVVFIAHFEAGTHGDVAWLVCDGEEVSSRDITISDSSTGFAFEWKLSLRNTESVRT